MSRDWTSRERIWVALAHQEPDRVPMSLEIAGAAYQKLRAYLGFPPLDQVSACGCNAVQPDPDVASFLGLDLTSIRLHPKEEYPPAPGTVFSNEWQVGRRVMEDGTLADGLAVSPLASARIQDLRDFAWPDPEDPARTQDLTEQAGRLYRESDLALVGSFGGSILQTTRDLRGEDQWSRDLVEDPDFVCALLNRVARTQIALDEAGLRACGSYLSIVEIREVDWGKPGRWLFPAAIWRDTIRPVLERRWRAVHQAMMRWASQARLLLYAPMPGLDVFPDLIEGQIDLFGPLQPGVPELEFSALKRSFGDRLGFLGGVDGGDLLETGSESDVRELVKDSLRRLRSSGGYILAPSQVVQAAAQPQNIIAMCETVKVYGRYPAHSRRLLQPIWKKW